MIFHDFQQYYARPQHFNIYIFQAFKISALTSAFNLEDPNYRSSSPSPTPSPPFSFLCRPRPRRCSGTSASIVLAHSRRTLERDWILSDYLDPGMNPFKLPTEQNCLLRLARVPAVISRKSTSSLQLGKNQIISQLGQFIGQ